MKTIQLTDTEARVTKVIRDEQGENVIVDFEWGGPSDRNIYDFDIKSLGAVQSHGGNLRSGWVVYESAKPGVQVGDTIPLVMPADAD